MWFCKVTKCTRISSLQILTSIELETAMGIIQKALSKRQVRDFAIVYYFGLFMFHVAAASP